MMLFRRAAVTVAALVVIACATPACKDPLPVHTDVRYDERFGEDTSMDVYEPEGVGPHPGVMFIHGGAWALGSKDEYTDAAKRFARSGYVAATINYRLIPKGEYPRLVQDCFCALSYLRANAAQYHLDPDRLAIMGYSAGGHLSSLLGVSADDDVHAPDCTWGRTGPPRAVIVGAAASHDLRGQDNSVTRMLFGGGPDDKANNYAHASPITHVGPNKPPYLFVHGTADWFVEEEKDFVMRDALAAAGNETHVLEVSGGGHLFQSTSDGEVTGEESDLTAESWIAVFDFLERSTRPR